jgi:predicted dehydrogenase
MRLGFIGGWGHHNLAQLLRSAPQMISATAFAGDGVDLDRPRSRAQKMPGARWFEDARQMLDEFQPDVVNVGAVYGVNGDWIAACLERAIPVVSDKPIAASWAQLDRLRGLSDGRPGRVIVTEFSSRSSAAMRAARDAVAQGLIGQVVLATAQKSYRFGERPAWYGDRSLYGGTTLWVASHALDFIRFATGLGFTCVYGQSVNLSKPQFPAMEECTVSMLELENGAAAVVHTDYNRPAKAPTHGDDRLRIAGSQGVIEVRDGRCELISDEREPTDITDRAQPLDAAMEMLHAAQGRASDAYGTASSLEMAAVLLAARDAADGRQRIPISR